jgi:hypothetical protein
LLRGFPQFCKTALLGSPEWTTFLPHLKLSASAITGKALIKTIIQNMENIFPDRGNTLLKAVADELISIPEA